MLLNPRTRLFLSWSRYKPHITVFKSLIQVLILSEIIQVHRLILFFLRSILILSPHLCVVLRWCVSASGFPITSLPCCHMPPPFNLLQTDPPVVIMKNSVHTPRKTHYISVTKADWLALFREITQDYGEPHAKNMNNLCRHTAELFNGKANS